MIKTILYVFALMAVLIGTLPTWAMGQELVRLSDGPISGSLSEDGQVAIFKGIPYAQSTSGVNRWRAPQPVEKWNEILKCEQSGSTCPQPDVMRLRFGIKQPPMGEDCLYVNVYVPANKPKTPLPVMVWIHGGGFVVGSADSYDGTYLAQKGVVFVSVNYRLGVFGFCDHASLAKEKNDTSGNYGLLDIVAALKWVSKNIDVFGGDRNNVTVFGQSSGGTAVCYLLGTPLSKGLMQRCIAQSSGAYDPLRSREVARSTGEKMFEAMGVNNKEDPLMEARQRTWQEVLKATSSAGIRFGPSRDGEFFQEEIIDLFASKHQHKIPLMIGSNANESIEEYTMAAWYFAGEQSKIEENVFRYVFTMPSKDPRFAGRGAVHAAEIPYVFGAGSPAIIHFTEADRSLSKTMSAMWIQFARNGNPNSTEFRIEWPKYESQSQKYLEFGESVKIGSHWKASECEHLKQKFQTTN